MIKRTEINPGRVTTSYLYVELLALLTGKTKGTIKNYFSKNKLKLINREHVVQYIKHHLHHINT